MIILIKLKSLLRSWLSPSIHPIDVWSFGCIFAEELTGKPLFPGNSVSHQLDFITDMLRTQPWGPFLEFAMRRQHHIVKNAEKQVVPFAENFPNADPLALKLLQRRLAFDLIDQPTLERSI